MGETIMAIMSLDEMLSTSKAYGAKYKQVGPAQKLSAKQKAMYKGAVVDQDNFDRPRVCLICLDGGRHPFIANTQQFSDKIGKNVDLDKLEFVQLHRDGDKDIVRVNLAE